MARKKVDEKILIETIDIIETDFGRTDLNELRDKVNELVRDRNRKEDERLNG